MTIGNKRKTSNIPMDDLKGPIGRIVCCRFRHGAASDITSIDIGPSVTEYVGLEELPT